MRSFRVHVPVHLLRIWNKESAKGLTGCHQRLDARRTRNYFRCSNPSDISACLKKVRSMGPYIVRTTIYCRITSSSSCNIQPRQCEARRSSTYWMRSSNFSPSRKNLGPLPIVHYQSAICGYTWKSRRTYCSKFGT